MASKVCIGCNSPNVTQWCYNCGTSEKLPYYCETCVANEHNRPRTAKHERVPIEAYLKVLDEHSATTEDHKKDAVNVFVHVDPNSYGLVRGPKFSITLDALYNTPTPVVAIVGRSGVGKSTLMRQLVKEGTPKPLAAPRHAQTSTSADIHAYIGSLSTNKPGDILLLDSEGTHGSSKPAASTASENSFNPERRKIIVNDAYPRLLYIFSSVFCYVFGSGISQQKDWEQRIEIYAHRTLNQPTLPVMIVVLNMVAKKAGTWDIKESTKAANLKDRFSNYYREVYVVHIPDRAAEQQIFEQQVDGIKQLIVHSIDTHAIPFSCGVVLKRQIEMAMEILSRDSLAEINLYPTETVSHLQSRDMKLDMENKSKPSRLMLESSDGKLIGIPLHIAKANIPMLIELEDTSTPYPLPNVTGYILEKLIEYMVRHYEHPEPIPDEKDEKRTDNISAWDKDFCNVDQPTLFELMLAANYLDIKPLIDVTCKTVANMIKGKTPEEIRRTFNIKNDFTPEEEEAIRKENEWCEEK